jgi:hypothetical protein
MTADLTLDNLAKASSSKKSCEDRSSTLQFDCKFKYQSQFVKIVLHGNRSYCITALQAFNKTIKLMTDDLLYGIKRNRMVSEP